MFGPEEIKGVTTKWDKRFLEMARFIALWSKDRSTKCACVLVKDNRVIATGYNGFPEGTEDYDNEEKHERPEKYFWFEHAERNAIYSAARKGVAVEGATAYVTGPPCVDCTRGMIQAGVVDVIIPKQHNMVGREDSVWAETAERCEVLMENADVGYYCMEIDE
jgi:dCMP deaminase